MTKKKDLKKRVRARQEKTGERYTTALGAEACGPLLRGEPAPRRIPRMADWVEARRFLSRVSAGTLGLSRDGKLVAFAWNDLTLVASVLLLHERKPLVVVGLLEDVARSSPQLALLGIGG